MMFGLITSKERRRRYREVTERFHDFIHRSFPHANNEECKIIDMIAIELLLTKAMQVGFAPTESKSLFNSEVWCLICWQDDDSKNHQIVAIHQTEAGAKAALPDYEQKAPDLKWKIEPRFVGN